MFQKIFTKDLFLLLYYLLFIIIGIVVFLIVRKVSKKDAKKKIDYLSFVNTKFILILYHD